MAHPVLSSAIAISIAAATVLTPSPAPAAASADASKPQISTPATPVAEPPTRLTSSQRADLTETGPGIDVTDRFAVSRESTRARAIATRSCRRKPMKTSLFRGSPLMWAEDTITFHYSSCARKIYSSSLLQRAGYIFPNIAKAKGTTRYYAAKAKHRWHGRYTIGAGVATPWGDVTVYSIDIRSDWMAEVIRLPDGQMIGHVVGEWE